MRTTHSGSTPRRCPVRRAPPARSARAPRRPASAPHRGLVREPRHDPVVRGGVGALVLVLLVAVAQLPVFAAAPGPERAILRHRRRVVATSRGRHDPRAAKLLRPHQLKLP